jgi:putative transposase
LAERRQLREDRPEDETAVGQEEVEIPTNPQLGRRGRLPGQQAEVETPGTHPKRPLSGSIPWRTGPVFGTEAAPKPGRHGVLVLKHLEIGGESRGVPARSTSSATTRAAPPAWR